MDRTDLFHGHIGGIDALARALLVAADLIEQDTLAAPLAERYRGWSGDLGAAITAGEETLASLADKVLAGDIDPDPTSGRQEMLENRVNSVVWNVEA
jgi:xylose isomerase